MHCLSPWLQAMCNEFVFSGHLTSTELAANVVNKYSPCCSASVMYLNCGERFEE